MTANSQAAIFSSELQQAEDGTWGYCIKRIDTGDIVAQGHGHEQDFAIEIMEWDLINLEEDEATNRRSIHDFTYEVSQSDDGLWQYQIHEKRTQKLLSAQSGLRCKDTAYAHIANALMAAGCKGKDASYVMLQGQGLMTVDSEGTIHLNVEGLGDDT